MVTEKDFLEHFNSELFGVISETADAEHLECYVVGGYVRDIFLSRPSNDIDVVVVGSGVKMAEAFAARLGKSAHLSVFRNFGTAQVKYKGSEIEFVGARKESYTHDSRKPIVEDGTLEDDQNRRDFTVNAIAVRMNREHFGELVDPFGGLDDLRDKILRTPLDPDVTFSDDPLRMMRCIRFSSQLKFFIDDDTFASIKKNAERIKIVSRERIIDEINKIVMSATPSKGFVLLDESGLLDYVFPELKRLQGVEVRNGVGHKDNFYHTLEVLDNIAAKTDNLWLRWAALLHDIGKPQCKKWEPAAGWTFHNHNCVGDKMVPEIFRKMKLPMNEKMKYVRKLVSLHMRPIVLAEDVVTDSAVRRLLFEAGDDIDDLMTLCEADITSKNACKKKRFLDNFQLVRTKLKDIEEKDRIRNFQPPVSGEDIMAAFGVLLANAGEHRGKEIFVPLEIKGKLIPGSADVPGSGGSQLISGLLMALPLCTKDSFLRVSEPRSIPYMYMTLDVLRHFGISTRSEMEGDAELLEATDWSGCNGISFKIRGGQKYRAADFEIEGDWSAAANFLVAGAIFGSVEIRGLDTKSLQADLTILDILVEAGASVSQIDEDMTLCVRKAPLEAFEMDLNNAPDLFPISAVLAAFCAGESRIAGAGRLSSKDGTQDSRTRHQPSALLQRCLYRGPVSY